MPRNLINHQFWSFNPSPLPSQSGEALKDQAGRLHHLCFMGGKCGSGKVMAHCIQRGLASMVLSEYLHSLSLFAASFLEQKGHAIDSAAELPTQISPGRISPTSKPSQSLFEQRPQLLGNKTANNSDLSLTGKKAD